MLSCTSPRLAIRIYIRHYYGATSPYGIRARTLVRTFPSKEYPQLYTQYGAVGQYSRNTSTQLCMISAHPLTRAKGHIQALVALPTRNRLSYFSLPVCQMQSLSLLSRSKTNESTLLFQGACQAHSNSFLTQQSQNVPRAAEEKKPPAPCAVHSTWLVFEGMVATRPCSSTVLPRCVPGHAHCSQYLS
jgi:hypothetical protein